MSRRSPTAGLERSVGLLVICIEGRSRASVQCVMSYSLVGVAWRRRRKCPMAEPDWTGKGKTIAALIEELQSFEDQTSEVRISFDGGDTSLPISLVGKSLCQGRLYATLRNCQDEPTAINHRA